jgi:Mg-chelatase subunit ChlD
LRALLACRSIDTSLRPNTTTIRKYVDLVLVPVTVTDGSSRLIAGLDQHNFQLYEDKQLQEIKHFSSEDAPVSIGILLDVSGSMATKVERAREALIELLKDSNPQDEFFLMTFANAPALVQDFTQNIGDVQNRLVFMVPQGRTALLDAIFLGIDNMKKAKYQRKALLVISNGGDNSSRYSSKSQTFYCILLVFSTESSALWKNVSALSFLPSPGNSKAFRAAGYSARRAKRFFEKFQRKGQRNWIISEAG